MARRPGFVRIVSAALIVGLSLSACQKAEPEVTAPAVVQGDSVAEAELRRQAKAMQRTVLEAALAGGAAGAGISVGASGDAENIGPGFAFGFTIGAAAGTYVGFVQRKYARRERRLERIKEDLDANFAEMQTTLFVMQQVAAAQKAELAALSAQAAAGQAEPQAIAREVAEAQANLSQMQVAIDGAAKRREEFVEARGLTMARRDTTSAIDGDLALLSARIAEMRGVAADLATAL